MGQQLIVTGKTHSPSESDYRHKLPIIRHSEIQSPEKEDCGQGMCLCPPFRRADVLGDPLSGVTSGRRVVRWAKSVAIDPKRRDLPVGRLIGPNS